jgi:hypothetical protein
VFAEPVEASNRGPVVYRERRRRGRRQILSFVARRNDVKRAAAGRPGAGPVVVHLDEVQNLHSHETCGKEAAKLVLDIIRLGRAFGAILVQATQRPVADPLPKAISANAGIQIPPRIMDDYAVDRLTRMAAGLVVGMTLTCRKGSQTALGVQFGMPTLRSGALIPCTVTVQVGAVNPPAWILNVKPCSAYPPATLVVDSTATKPAPAVLPSIRSWASLSSSLVTVVAPAASAGPATRA